jgi:hypothetical protein
MKKLLFVLFVTGSLIACTTQSAKNEQKAIGFDTEGGDQKTALFGGDTANVKIFENFIKTLNDKDTASVRKLEALENLKIFTSDGRVVTNVDSNIKNISAWFTNSNPKWKLNFAVANSYTDKNGQLQEWVTSSGTITTSNFIGYMSSSLHRA